MSSGYHYRGANVPGKLERLLAEATARFNALSPEEQEAHREAQRESYVRGEMAMGSDRDEAKLRYGRDITEVQSPLPPQAMGYTGDTCMVCQSTRMLRTGHCSTCQDCGSTTDCA